MTAKGESNKGGPTKRGLQSIEVTATSLEATIGDPRGYSFQVSGIGFTRGKTLNFIKARDLKEMSWLKHTMIMSQSTRKIKSTSSTRSINLSHGSSRDMNQARFTTGNWCRFNWLKFKQTILLLK